MKKHNIFYCRELRISGSPEAMRFVSQQHRLGYGDESWATESMLKSQSPQQQYQRKS